MLSPHHEVFLQAIADDPDNTTPGLIYADWLGERGRPWESYWRDPQNYCKVWSPIFSGYGPPDGFGAGHDVSHGDSHLFEARYPDFSLDGDGYGDGSICGDGASYEGPVYGNGYGDGSGIPFPSDARIDNHPPAAALLRMEVLG